MFGEFSLVPDVLFVGMYIFEWRKKEEEEVEIPSHFKFTGNVDEYATFPFIFHLRSIGIEAREIEDWGSSTTERNYFLSKKVFLQKEIESCSGLLIS